MYSKFKVSTSDDYSSYYEIGKIHLEEQKTNIEKRLEEFIDYDTGIIDGRALEEELFKEIEADIFLSHSHSDEKLAVGFAGWLKTNFNLTAFVDSCVWKYADDILKEINNRYNLLRTEKDGSKTYSHSKANYAASHIYLMLNSALNNMINKTECFMFIDTEHSCIHMDKTEAPDKTLSPWIYSEIVMANTMKITFPDRPFFTSELRHSFSESLKISHDLDLSTFFYLGATDLANWKYQNKGDMHPLDKLYSIKSKGNRK